MSLDQFFELAKANGVEGMVTALFVLVFVYLAKFGGLVKNGDVARIVNAILAVVFGGFQFGDSQSGFVTVIASIVSALLFELVSWLSTKLPKPAAKKK